MNFNSKFVAFSQLISIAIFLPISASIHSHHKTVYLRNLEIQVEDAKSGKFLGKFNVENGEKFPKILRLEKQIAVKIEFQIVEEGNGGKLIEGIQQAFLRLWHSKTGDHEVFFIAKENPGERGKYSLKIDMQKDQARFKSRPGRYNCELIVGDARVQQGVRWHFIDAFVDVAKAIKPQPRSYEPRNRFPKYEMETEIRHIFKPIETCNFKFSPIFYIFSLICALPLLFLLKSWFPFFGDILPAFFSFSSILPWAQLFFGFLSSIFAFYVVNWVRGKSIAYTLQFLPFIGALCFLAGHFALKMVAKERIETEPEEEEEEIVGEELEEMKNGDEGEFESNVIVEEIEFEEARNAFEPLEDIMEEEAEEIFAEEQMETLRKFE